MKRALRIAVIVMRIALGGLFVYAGIQKFIPKERPKSESTVELPDHVVKIKAFIGGMKQTGYFWELQRFWVECCSSVRGFLFWVPSSYFQSF